MGAGALAARPDGFGGGAHVLDLATGELVHLLHGDDMVLPGFYSQMERALADHPMAMAAVCRVRDVDADNATTYVTRSYRRGTGVWTDAFEDFAVSNRVRAPGIVVRRAAYEQVGGYRTDLPHAADWDRNHTFPSELFAELGELGLMGVCVPAEHGGAGADFLAYMLVLEELSRGDAGVGVTVGAGVVAGAVVAVGCGVSTGVSGAVPTGVGVIGPLATVPTAVTDAALTVPGAVVGATVPDTASGVPCAPVRTSTGVVAIRNCTVLVLFSPTTKMS